MEIVNVNIWNYRLISINYRGNSFFEFLFLVRTFLNVLLMITVQDKKICRILQDKLLYHLEPRLLVQHRFFFFLDSYAFLISLPNVIAL